MLAYKMYEDIKSVGQSSKSSYESWFLLKGCGYNTVRETVQVQEKLKNENWKTIMVAILFFRMRQKIAKTSPIG